jgi:type IV secretory pathway VirB9-like protein
LPLAVVLEPAPLVQVPPSDAVPTLVEKPRGRQGKGARHREDDPTTQAGHGSLLTPSRGGFADNTSSILRYPYRTGAVYLITSSPAHATTLLLPPGLRIAANPVLDPEHWDVGFAEMGEEGARQEAIIVRPATPGLEATTPLLTKSGHLFLIRLRSQEKPGVLAATWELPLVQILTATGQGSQEKPAASGPKIDLARLHTQYKIEPGKQPVNWTPVEVYDDAKVTVVRFAESLEYTAAPVLMAVTPDGKQTLPLEYVTYAVPGHKEKGEFYLTKGIYPRLRLLDGQQGTVDLVRLPTPAPTYAEQSHAIH